MKKLSRSAFHFFAYNVKFSICTDRLTYEIKPFYFYILHQCAVRHKTWVKKGFYPTKMRAVGTQCCPHQ